MDRFLRLFNSGLQLSESENLEVVISYTAMERLRVLKFFLVGKVLTHKYLRPNIFMGVIKDLWPPKASVEATTIGDNRILFSFNSEEEVRVVLRGSPWFFGLVFLGSYSWAHSGVYVQIDGGGYWSSLGSVCQGQLQ
ncbi:hypothetical protein ACFX2F_025765 [Malus domestica]